MNLCIDWGNTRVKAAIFNGENLVAHYNFSEEEALMSLRQVIEDHQPTDSILSAVANHPTDLVDMLEEKTRLQILTADTSLPLINAYSADTLGSDRVALAVASHSESRGHDSLVISVGTAITYNFVQGRGFFRGGAISPGIRLRFEALHQFTDQLPLVDAKGELLLLGYDTNTGIRSGVINGILYEIDGMIDAFKAQYPDLVITLTGGDAPFFADKLKSRIFADPNFLLRGLNLILRHNAR